MIRLVWHNYYQRETIWKSTVPIESGWYQIWISPLGPHPYAYWFDGVDGLYNPDSDVPYYSVSDLIKRGYRLSWYGPAKLLGNSDEIEMLNTRIREINANLDHPA